MLTKFTIIQDKRREEALVKENKIRKHEFVCVPNSLIVKSSPRATRYLQKKYALNDEQIVILVAGGIAEGFMCQEIAAVASSDWPDNWTLIIHGMTNSEEYYNNLKTFEDGTKVILSRSFLSWDELDSLVSSAHIGLALYKMTYGFSLNRYHMASGKLMQYLKCGIPTIAIDFPNLREIVVDNHCGECVSDEKGIKNAISQILSDYDSYRKNAWSTYVNKYDFRIHFQKVIEKIEKGMI